MNNTNLKKRIVPIIFGIAVIIVLSTIYLYSQCCKMKGHDSHSDNNLQNSRNADTTIVRKGIIDVNEIDLNKDGKVFQDPMDWNVISDTAGKCPLCKMTLKEVTIKEAKENLIKHGFKVK
jgi:membrane fusion protein, copper/silver efflux system